jgi:AcrR family transcriptional regulator
MTKKEMILQTALRLFAERGYDQTPTSLIAKEAGVSTGLVFTHFSSKEGLLEGILRLGIGQVASTMAPYTEEKEPRTAILEHIARAFDLIRANHPFWKLVQQLRFQPAVQLAAAQSIADFQHAVNEQLTRQFMLLGAPAPETEARLLFALIDGITVQYIQSGGNYPLDEMQLLLTQKYQHGYFLG